MDKSHHPTAFGVFKPVGHTVIAFSSREDMEAAHRSLLGQGFAPDELVRYSAREMIAQIDEDLQAAKPARTSAAVLQCGREWTSLLN